MNVKLALALSGLGLLGIGTEDDPGWLAEALAGTDSDVEAAVDAYAAEDYDGASKALDAAVGRRGERSELSYNRGLIALATGDTEAAPALFQHGTTSDTPQVRASSHYQLGNLALASEDWAGAIESFSECLRVQPDHQNAKWNLELALQRKHEKEEQEKKDQEKQDQEKKDQEKKDQEKQDGEQDQQDGEQGEQEQQDGEQGEQEKPKAEEPKAEEPKPEEPKPPQAEKPEPSDQQAQAQAAEADEIDAALEELDRQDAFMFGRPRNTGRKVDKDW